MSDSPSGAEEKRGVDRPTLAALLARQDLQPLETDEQSAQQAIKPEDAE
jgi:hypothetical protein